MSSDTGSAPRRGDNPYTAAWKAGQQGRKTPETPGRPVMPEPGKASAEIVILINNTLGVGEQLYALRTAGMKAHKEGIHTNNIAIELCGPEELYNGARSAITAVHLHNNLAAAVISMGW